MNSPDRSATLAHYTAQAALAELQRLQGVGLKPQAGCKLVAMALGDATVIVEYEYSPGSPGRSYMPNGDPGYPDEPAELAVIGVLINGAMCDASEVIPAAIIERWEQQIAEDEIEAAADGGYCDDREDYDYADDYLSDKAACQYERELDARASQ